MHWYLEVLKKYAVFSGRARRKEYWWFGLITGIIALVLSLPYYLHAADNVQLASSCLVSLYSLATLVPTFAVEVRRLHDTNHSGWWVFIGLVPIIGEIVLLVWLVTDSDPGENQYGPNPKSVSPMMQTSLPA